MTAAADPDAAVVPRRLGPGGRAVLCGCLLAAFFMAPQAWSVWQRNTFLDPDDAMRAVELRDFLAGQGWFDLVPHRLSPEHPFIMHWSRLVDAPLAVAMRVLELALSPDRAERLVRIAEPLALFGLTLWATLGLVARLVGRHAMLPAAVGLAASPQLLTNFLPGHIHHHALQVTLLVGATAAVLRALPPGARPGFAALAGGLVSLSLGIGLQSLPFAMALAATVAAAWVWYGAVQARSLAGFGAGLGATIPVFLLDVPPGHYSAGACDSFSAAHLVTFGSTAVVFFVLAVATRYLPGRVGRALAGAAGAALVLVLEATFYPACLHDPMAGVDPLLRSGWLSGVGEALPLGRLIGLAPPDGIALLLTLLGGLGATAWAARCAPAAERPRWLALLLLVLVGFVGALWEVRVAASAEALAIPGLAWLALGVFDAVSRRPQAPALLAAAIVVAFGNGAGWAAVAKPLAGLRRSGAAEAAAPDPAACFDPANLSALAALPPGLVLSTIDPGSTILAFTPHSVLAAPYHRDTFGIRVSLLALAAPPDEARAMMRDAHVRYLALCRASNETRETAALHPYSLSAAVLAGRVPAWLQPRSAPDAVFLLYEVGAAAS